MVPGSDPAPYSHAGKCASFTAVGICHSVSEGKRTSEAGGGRELGPKTFVGSLLHPS